MYGFINSTGHHILLELRKKGRWMAGSCRVHVTWGMCTGLSEILNHNEQLPLLLRAYMYTKLQTWHIHCCHGWLNSLPQNLLHIDSSNPVIIFIVVMLGNKVAQWLRHYPTRQKVASSIPDIIGSIHWHNPSNCTMAQGSTHPIREMSTRNISWGVNAAVA